MSDLDFLDHFPGCVSALPEDEFAALWASGRPLRIKLGFDPTATQLHLGHTVLLTALQTFQRMGHHIVLIIGDFTACIGDPTMRDVTRPPLSRETVRSFAQEYTQQLFRFLDPQKTEVHYNSTWLDPIGLQEWVGVLGKVTLGQMTERDDFQKRISKHQPVFGHELMYPLLQAYDSVAIQADIELGGTDQTFNLMMGRTLQKIYGQRPQVVMTFPLLVGLDGQKKMSKSYGNTIGIDDAPDDIYGKIMSLSDASMWIYYDLVSGLDREGIAEKRLLHPMRAKQDLAALLVERFYDADRAEAAAAQFAARFSHRSQEVVMPERHVTPEEQALPWPQLLRALGVVSSASEALRLMQQGAVKVNSERLTADLPKQGPCVLRVGKKHLLRLVFPSSDASV